MPLFVLLAGAAILLVLLMPTKALGYVAGVATEITLGDIGQGYMLRSDAATAFRQMQAAATADGVPLTIDDGFRTMESQTELYNEYIAGTRTSLVGKPGYSNHQSGIAVDIAVQSSNTSVTYRWLADNAADYGFKNTGASFSKPEFWHWEFLPT